MFDNYGKYYGKFKFEFPELDALFEMMKEKNIILDATCYHGTVNGLKEAAIFTKKAHKMGVKVAAGTDYLGDQPLPYIHDELETFVKHCDFTPYEALRSATVIAAETFKMQDKIGTIEKGKIADLLLLNANPLEKITNTKEIHLIIKEGFIYKN
jgi:imidazolonepropionase-like amidohydrolase